jgi:hypothetical protein
MPKKQNRKASRSQWERESGKESFWRKQIAAWKASGQTVRSFAKANGFSQQLFYSWRREISIRDRELSVAATAGAARDSSGIANSHVTDARGRVVPLRFRDTPKDAIKTGPFVPATVVPDVADTSKPKGAASHQLASVEQASPAIEINLPGRSVLRVRVLTICLSIARVRFTFVVVFR